MNGVEVDLTKALAAFDAWRDSAKARCVREVQLVTLAIDANGKENTPVDKGRLRAGNQFRFEDDGLTGVNFNEVEYAIYVHEGARGRAGRPWLTDAHFAQVPKFQAAIAAALGRVS